eukprot:1537790-Alexandrium_andersonii.AAC.1
MPSRRSRRPSRSEGARSAAKDVGRASRVGGSSPWPRFQPRALAHMRKVESAPTPAISHLSHACVPVPAHTHIDARAHADMRIRTSHAARAGFNQRSTPKC